MRAVTFQAPGEVRVDERPDPELGATDDAVVRVEATGVCGSDLHIYHGRVQIEPGFVIGHEFVGTVVAAGDDVTRAAVGDRVIGTYCTACGDCFFCASGDFHKCDNGRVFGHGAALGSLQGAQAEQVLVPTAEPHPPSGARGRLRRGGVVRGGRDGHRLPRRRGDRHRARATASPCWGSDPSASAPCRPAKAAGAETVVAVDTRPRAARDGALLRRHARAPHRAGRPRGRSRRQPRGAVWTPRSTRWGIPTCSTWRAG